MLGDFKGDFDAVVVDIRHQGNHAALLSKCSTNFGHGLRMANRRRRHPNDFTASFHKPKDSCDGPIYIEGVLVDHRLNNDRMLTADRHITHHHGAGHTSMDLGVVTPIQGSHEAQLEAVQGSHRRC